MSERYSAFYYRSTCDKRRRKSILEWFPMSSKEIQKITSCFIYSKILQWYIYLSLSRLLPFFLHFILGYIIINRLMHARTTYLLIISIRFEIIYLDRQRMKKKTKSEGQRKIEHVSFFTNDRVSMKSEFLRNHTQVYSRMIKV